MQAARWNPNPSVGLKRVLLQGFHSALALSGLASIYVKARGVRGATILMYHSVAAGADCDWLDPRNHLDPRTFEEQMSFLARHRQVVSMSDLVSAIQERRDLPAGSVVITFDDGYLDNLTMAAPILAEKGLPAILYLASAYVDRGENQWIDRLYSLFKARTRQELILPAEGEGSRRFKLSDSAQEADAYKCGARFLLEGTWPQREALLKAMEDQLAPEKSAPRLTLRWDEVLELRRRYPRFEIGAHTRNHVDLTHHAGSVLEDEIGGCTEEIRRALGTRPVHFSYPYARWNPEARAGVERDGYRSAVGSGTEFLITHQNDCFALPRIEANMSVSRLKFVTSGAYPALSRVLVGRP